MTGTHTELLAKSPIYRELYESQMGGSQSDIDAAGKEVSHG